MKEFSLTFKPELFICPDRERLVEQIKVLKILDESRTMLEGISGGVTTNGLVNFLVDAFNQLGCALAWEIEAMKQSEVSGSFDQYKQGTITLEELTKALVRHEDHLRWDVEKS